MLKLENFLPHLQIFFIDLKISQKCDLGKQFNMMVRLEASWRHLYKMSWRCLKEVLKMPSKRLEDVLKMYSQDEYVGLDQDVLKAFSRRLLNTKIKVFFKTSSSRWMFAEMCFEREIKSEIKFWIFV